MTPKTFQPVYGCGTPMLTLVPNDPLDLMALESLLADKDELFLVWPQARFPFDREQWRERLLARPQNRSYFVALEGRTIGHAALLETDEPGTMTTSYLFIAPEHRGGGFGPQLMTLLEREARTFGVEALRLRVRSYNPRAMHVYTTAGFTPMDQDGTLVTMRKPLLP